MALHAPHCSMRAPTQKCADRDDPQALVQFTLESNDAKELRKLAHEGGDAPISRGHLVHITNTDNLFISLAVHGEHQGWEGMMTTVGVVPEPELTDLVEGKILNLPKHNFTHPEFKTVMSMLDNEISCRLREA